MEVESGTGGDRDIRPPSLDNTTAVVYLTDGVEPLRIESKMPAPGEYLFLVHYYQPVHPGKISVGVHPAVPEKCFFFACQ